MPHTITRTYLVEHQHTAAALGHGRVAVLGTPFLLSFMEFTCNEVILDIEGADAVTVGTRADFTHDAATPVGAEITVSATLANRDRRKFTFDVVAHDPAGEIGRGRHERFLLKDLDVFLAETARRRG